MKRVTIYDVAKEANVSLATVSRVVNGSSVVKPPTKQKVEETIKRLGYKPNAIAQGLALQKTTTVGMIITDASEHITGQIINGVLDAAKIKHYNIIIHTISAGITDTESVIDIIIKSRVDGVIIYDHKLDLKQVEGLSNFNIPIVFIDNDVSNESVGSVYVDKEKITIDACNLFLNKNITDVKILQERHNSKVNQKMISGAEKAFKDKKLKFDGYLEIPDTYKSSYEFMKNYLTTNTPKAIIVNRDTQALAIINAANEKGLNVPNDLEVVCLSDSKYNLTSRPQISSFSLPSYDLGSIAMASIEKILNENEVGKTYELSYFYIKRESTK